MMNLFNNKTKEDHTSDTKNSLVLLCWQNYGGVRQGKLIPSNKYDVKDDDFQVKFSTFGLFFPAYKDVALQGLKLSNAPKQLRLIPDRASERKSPFHKNHRLVFSKLQNPDGSAFVGCPRTQLERALGQLKTLGYELQMGIEIEFSVLDAQTLKPIENNLDCNIHSTVNQIDDFDEIFQTMEEHDIHAEAIHKEASPGQFEIVLKYANVKKILDDYYIAKEIISQHFRKKGQIVTYLPKPFAESMGNGAHIHLSLWKDGKNHTGNPSGLYQLTEEAESFMAGIFEDYEALVHFLCPTPNSLRRFQGQQFVGTYKNWGIENKEAPLRLTVPLRIQDKVSHFEIKSLDHTAHHYFALAAIIAMGTRGIKNNLKLPQPFNQDADLITESKRKELGIMKLPSTFEERKKTIQSSKGDALREHFGEDYINNLLIVHQADFDHFKDATIEEEVKELLERY